MATQFTWSIQQMDRLTSDGFVVTVHYNVTATDGTFTVSTYGTVPYTQTQGATYVPYASLTQAQVVGWVQTSIGLTNTQASLQSQLTALENPVQASGMPWAPSTVTA